MDRSSLIVIVMLIVIPVALFTGIALPFIGGGRSGRSPAQGRLARPNALKRISAAGRKAWAAQPGAHDATPAEYLYVPCARIRYHGQTAQTHRWVQEVPIVKKTDDCNRQSSCTHDLAMAVPPQGIVQHHLEPDNQRAQARR